MAFKRSGVRFPSPPWQRGGAERLFVRGNSSVGSAQPCQGWGRGFESRFPLSGPTRAGQIRNGDRYVLRRAEALQRSRGSRDTTEIRTTVVGSVLLFVGRHVAKVRLHRGDVRLVLGIRELRNRDRGKNADDDDHDQKLNKGKTLFVAHLRLS